MTPSPPANSKQVATAGLVVPHPEKVTPNSKARIHRDFGYGGEDSFYCAWGPRCVLQELPHCLYQACILPQTIPRSEQGCSSLESRHWDICVYTTAILHAAAGAVREWLLTNRWRRKDVPGLGI